MCFWRLGLSITVEPIDIYASECFAKTFFSWCARSQYDFKEAYWSIAPDFRIRPIKNRRYASPCIQIETPSVAYVYNQERLLARRDRMLEEFHRACKILNIEYDGQATIRILALCIIVAGCVDDISFQINIHRYEFSNKVYGEMVKFAMLHPKVLNDMMRRH